MIIQENDFLRTYNEIDSLWEEAESNTGYSEYSFDEVASKAITDAAIIENMNKAEGSYTGEKINIEYWCELKQLLENKAYSFGRVNNLTWYSRFLSFYQAYKAELAILKLFQENPKLRKAFKNCSFPDPHQAKLRPDTNVAKPDITSAAGDIECKEYTSTSSVHGAEFVVRHTPIQTTSTEYKIKAWIVGHKENLKAVFGGLRIPKYAYILEPARSLSTGLDRQPQDLQALQCTVTGIHAGLKIALEVIDTYLNRQDNVKAQAAAQIVNKQTKVIDAAIEKFGGEPLHTTAETDIESAVQNLKDSADALKTTIINN